MYKTDKLRELQAAINRVYEQLAEEAVQSIFDAAPNWKAFVSEARTPCECGKDKHGFASHAQWCPRHDVIG